MSKLSVSKHAIDEAVKDFRVRRELAEDWIRSNFRKAQFIADIVSAEGEPCRLFGFQRIAFIAADSADFIKTVYPRHTAVPEVYDKVAAVIQRELRKAQRQVRAAERRITVEKARLNREIAEAQWKMAITPSRRVIDANKRKISEIERQIAALDKELLREKKEMSAIAKSIVAYV